MSKRLLSLVGRLGQKLPLIYSIILIVLVPLTLVFNTLWSLRAYERDMNFAVRDELLTVYSIATALLNNQEELNTETYQNFVLYVNKNIPELTGVSVVQPDKSGTYRVVATNREDLVDLDQHHLLNSLAWSNQSSYFSEVYDQSFDQNVWMLVAPIFDQDNKPTALINLKVGTNRVDAVIGRTSRDALIIMLVSVVFVVLLLLNHARFYEHSLMYSKLQEINQMKDDFISVASHELRTPLTAIKSYVAMVESDLGPKISEKTQHRLWVIRQSLQRLENLVEDLLNVSRIEQNRLDFSLSPIDPWLVIEEVTNQLLPTAQDKNLELIVDKPDESHRVIGNADRLREVLTNLVGNAIKYTPSGSVTVSSEIDKGKYKILVKDTGLGISPEDQEKLFQKFSRIRNNKTRDIPGTGLGLWITKQMVERMQGQIFVDSVPGQGTVFTVVLKLGDK